MGQKAHPKSVRLGYIRDWDSKWFNLKEMPDFVEEDFHIRRYLKDKMRSSAISKICIERAGKYLRVNIHTARPGVVIGKGGQGIENIQKELEQIADKKTFVNVIEVKNPEVDAQLVAESVAMQLEKQVSYRRAIKRAMERAMQSGAQGIKIMVAGRLGGAEIARTEWLKEGRIPLQTFRADIDYGFAEAHTVMGHIGVKTCEKETVAKKTVEIPVSLENVEATKGAELIAPESAPAE